MRLRCIYGSIGLILFGIFVFAAFAAEKNEFQSVRARFGNPQKDNQVDQVELPPARGMTYYISPGEKETGDGTRQNPWHDFSKALPALKPGDRLILLPGAYRQPLRIDGTCRAGKADAPIELLANVDAVLSVGQADDSQPPVIAVSQSYWHFYGLEITPGNSASPGFKTCGAGARHILLQNSHIRDGYGDGVVIGPHSRYITINKSHIHHMGHPEKGKQAVGIRIMPGTRYVEVINSSVHNCFAGAHLIVPLDQHPIDKGGNKLTAAEDIYLEGNQVVNNW